MHLHPLRQIIEACDRAISAQEVDTLMGSYAEDAALVLMETVLHYPDGQGITLKATRRATTVFRQDCSGHWLCTIDNSYGTSLLDAGSA